jgi:hypothetical protein
MPATLPDISNPRDAIAASKAVRASVRGRPADDADRRARLAASLVSLGECWTEAHESYVRSLPRSAAAVDGDPVRAVAHARRAEMKALRSALSPVAGSRPPAPKAPGRDQIWGTLGNVTRKLNALDRDHAAIRETVGRGEIRTSPSGGTYRSMVELNKAAAGLLDDLTEYRRHLTTQFNRFERHARAHKALWNTLAKVRDRVDEIRMTMRGLARELRDSATRKRPLARTRQAPGTWTRERAVTILRSFKTAHGRLPTRRELDANHTLPHYTQLRRWFGDRPLSSAPLLNLVS